MIAGTGTALGAVTTSGHSSGGAVSRPSDTASTKPAEKTSSGKATGKGSDASGRQRPGKFPNKRRSAHEWSGRNQYTPGTGTPRLEWQAKRLSITVPDGSAVTTTVRLKVTGRPKSVTAVIGGDLKGVVEVGLDRLAPLGHDRYELPIDVVLPAKAKKFYRGTIALRQGKRMLGRPLPVNVVVTQPASGGVPTSATPPSPSRVTGDGTKFVADELVLLVSDDAADPGAVALDAARKAGGIVYGAVPATRTYQIRFIGIDPKDLDAKATLLRGTPGVEDVSRNFVTTEGLVTPDDTEWDSWGNPPAGNNANLEYIGMPDAWGVTTGSSSIKMAVIDNDMDRNHSDLDDNIGRIDGRGSETADGHGTHVAGTICAEGNNHKGVSGIMWDCDLRLFPAGPFVSDSVTTQEQMVKAADDGARVVNMSLGYNETNMCGRTSDTPESLANAKKQNAIFSRAVLYAQRAKHDVLWVFAAGNECRNAAYQSPASLVEEFPLNTITVANATVHGALQPTSNFGNLITVAAPGTNVLSTVPRDCFFGLFCRDKYATKTGTSMAAPQVAGLAGLLFSHDPSLTAAKAKTCIVNGARKSGPAVEGHAFHVINAPAALACEGAINLPAKVDVVLSMDLTGSMGGVLDQAKSQVTQAIADIKAASPSTDFRFAVTSYEDYPGIYDSSKCGTSTYSESYGSAPDAPFRVNQVITADGATVQSAINALQLGGGDDGPEAYARALWEVAQPDTGMTLGLRPDALKLVVNFGDNVPHDPNINEGVDGGELAGDTGIDPGRNGVIDCGGDDLDFQKDTLGSLKTAKVKLLEVDSSGGTSIEPYWRYWASQTGGAYTKLNRDDGRSLSEVILELLSLLPPS